VRVRQDSSESRRKKTTLGTVGLGLSGSGTAGAGGDQERDARGSAPDELPVPRRCLSLAGVVVRSLALLDYCDSGLITGLIVRLATSDLFTCAAGRLPAAGSGSRTARNKQAASRGDRRPGPLGRGRGSSGRSGEEPNNGRFTLIFSLC